MLEEGRALMVAINKWDVAEDASGLFNGIRAALDEGLAQLKGVPLLAVSARTGKGLDQLLAAAFEIREQWSRRVPTAALNRWFDKAMEANPPPAPGGRRIKLRYITRTPPARRASWCSAPASTTCPRATSATSSTASARTSASARSRCG
jgi:GTP-binding protein